MLTLVLCLVATVSGQYPYPPAAPEGDSLQPYPPPVQQAVEVRPEGPYPPARAVEIPRTQPVVAAVPRPQPVIGYTPGVQPVRGQFPRTQPVVAAVPRPQPVIGYTPGVQPVRGQFPRTQPVVAAVPRPQPVIGYTPGVQPVRGQFPRTQPVVAAVPRPQPVIGYTPGVQPVIGEVPRSQPVLFRKAPVNPYPAQVHRYQYQPTPAVQIRPLLNTVVETPKFQQYKAAQPIRVQGSPYRAALTKQPYREGGELSPGELEAPVQPTIRYGLPNKSVPSGSGGELSPDELELPPNTQINLQDKHLQYSHGFSDDQGTEVKEQGSLFSTNEGWEYVIAKKGSYSYVSPEGIPIKVNYIADDNGFRVLPNE